MLRGVLDGARPPMGYRVEIDGTFRLWGATLRYEDTTGVFWPGVMSPALQGDLRFSVLTGSFRPDHWTKRHDIKLHGPATVQLLSDMFLVPDADTLLQFGRSDTTFAYLTTHLDFDTLQLQLQNPRLHLQALIWRAGGYGREFLTDVFIDLPEELRGPLSVWLDTAEQEAK